MTYDEELLAEQLSSQVRVQSDDTWIDLDPAAASRLGIPLPAYKITADNPQDLDLSDDENDRRQRQLKQAIEEAGLPHLRGSAGNGDHWEDGFVVWDTDRATVCQIAERFGQLSVFELTADELRVVDAASHELLASRITKPDA